MNTDSILGAHPFDVYRALDTMFGEERWLSWEPEVLLHELADEVSEQARDKVLAVQAVAANGALACGKAAAFENVVHAFCNNALVVDSLQPPTIEEVMYTIPQLEKIIKQVHSDAEVSFYGEIPRYVAAVAKYRGWVVLPTRLGFAQDALDELTGCSPESDKYQEFKGTLQLIKGLVASVAETAITTSDEVFSLIEEDTPKALVIRLVLGAYLYDPTIPYRQA